VRAIEVFLADQAGDRIDDRLRVRIIDQRFQPGRLVAHGDLRRIGDGGERHGVRRDQLGGGDRGGAKEVPPDPARAQGEQ